MTAYVGAAGESRAMNNDADAKAFWWQWALSSVGIFLSIVAFAITNNWNIVSEVAAAASSLSFDGFVWGNWVEVGSIIVGSLAGGAAAAVTLKFAITHIGDKVNAPVASGQGSMAGRGNSKKEKTVHKQTTNNYATDADALRKLENVIRDLPDDVGEQIRKAVSDIRGAVAPEQVALPVGEYKDIEQLLSETLRNRQLQGQLRHSRRKRRELATDVAELQSKIDRLNEELVRERTNHQQTIDRFRDAQEDLAEADRSLAMTQDFFRSIRQMGLEADGLLQQMAQKKSAT